MAHTRSLTRQQLLSAEPDAVVEVSLSSPCIISVLPSDEVLRPKKQEAISSAERIEWFVFTETSRSVALVVFDCNATAGSKQLGIARRMLPCAPRSAQSR
jgi:hypothetical protein